MHKNNTYVDVTQLIHWQGFVAGIPRVMYELSRRFRNDKTTDIVYVSWVKEIGSYCEVDFFDTMKRRNKEGGISYIYDKDIVSTQLGDEKNSRSLFFWNRIRRLGKGIAKRALIKVGMLDMPLVKNVQTDMALREAKRYKKIIFSSGDVVFISWGDWWDENFLRMLEEGVADYKIKIVPVIHDVLPFTQTPQFSGHSTDSLMEYCRRIVSISSLTLCVSQSTKRDLEGWFEKQGVKMPHMEVFRLGEDFEFADAIEPTDEVYVEADIKGRDYLLCVGTFEAKKNHTLLYYVYKLAKARGLSLPKLVIVGRKGWKTEPLHDFMTEDPEVKNQFVFLHNASDENLSWLYDHALGTVFPSFAEGWGIPIAESVARGVPCACSNTTSMTEIAEEYVIHFSPASTDECLAAIQEIIKPDVQKRMRSKNSKYKQTTWEDSFNQVFEYMKEYVYGK